MKQLSVLVLTSALLLVISASTAQPGLIFTLADIQGSFGFSLDGAFVDGRRVAAVGSFDADGAGNIMNGVRTLVVATVSSNPPGGPGPALVTQQTFTCLYLVNPNGTGTASCPFVFSDNHTATETLAFVIDRNRREIQFIGTDTISVVRGVAVRQELP